MSNVEKSITGLLKLVGLSPTSVPLHYVRLDGAKKWCFPPYSELFHLYDRDQTFGGRKIGSCPGETHDPSAGEKFSMKWTSTKGDRISEININTFKSARYYDKYLFPCNGICN